MGECNIVVTTSNGKTASCSVTIINSEQIEVTGVTLNEKEIKLGVDETFKLIADIMPENADNKDVTWKSSDKSVATVSSKGLVTAKGEGSAIITVTTKDGGFTATCKVNVGGNKVDVDPTTIIVVSSSVAVVGLGVGLGVGIPVSIRKKHKKIAK